MPWLVGTALLHSAIVVEKRDTLKSWTVLLAIVTFSLSLIGTFLVRSGVLTSVHAFATDPARGLFILGFLVVAIGGSLALYAWRAPALTPGGSFLPLSREGALVLNNVLLISAAAAVFLGTLYPLVLEALGGEKISVGAPYFHATFVPIMVPLVAAMAFGPLLAWKRGDLAAAFQRLRPALIAALAILFAVLFVTAAADVLAAFGIGLAVWLFVGAFVEWAERIKILRVPARDSLRLARNLPRAAYGMTVAHIGVAIAIAGIVASSSWKTESILTMRPGDHTTLAGYTVTFNGVETVRGPNYLAQRGSFAISEGSDRVALMTPEKRAYVVERSTTTEAAIHTTWFADLYVVLGDPDHRGGWAVRLYHNPLVPWIWTGALVMFAGGLLSLSDRRLRVGAPRRSRRAATPSDAAPARA
jgi:cytochrome c-type biogenesis protein CcmF